MKTPRISVKIFCFLGIIVLVIITIHTLLYQNLTRKNIISQINLRGEELGNPLWQSVNSFLESRENPASFSYLNRICKQIKESAPDVFEVSVVDQNGYILAHNEAARVGMPASVIRPGKSEQPKKHIFNETPFSLDTYLPVYHADYETPFLVKLSFSKNLLKTYNLQALTASIIFSFSAIGLFLLAIYFLINTLIGKRIARLLNGFDALAKGDLNVRLTNENKPGKEKKHNNYKDEVDFLMESFDEMAKRLEDSDHKRRQQEKQLRFLATHDPLTGLPNRRLLEHALKKAVSRARRGQNSALVLMDLDNFKYVNDTLGHSVGDQVLVTLTELLRKQLRASDLLGVCASNIS